MNETWYFNDELSPSDELVDKFADSKFGIDRWSSFAREIIQNSLDAQYDDGQPVEVIFDLNKNLTLKDIPGGERTKEILELCASVATNKQTKNSYEKGLEILSKDYVRCLKISDKNTRGVRTGRDEAWGAFVFDEGRSVKQRPGSAGSHGVGKKVPFIISGCNTVFYATKNRYIENGVEKSDCLVQGKTTLINWVDLDNKRKSSKGWYGLIGDDVNDTKNIVKPIDANNCSDINPYFLRKEEYGTDVIVVGVNIYDNESEIKGYIINAVLENYFVAIKQDKLNVEVFGEQINSNTFEDVVRKYYKEQDDKHGVTLSGCLRVYDEEVSHTEDIFDTSGNKIGSINIYFGLGSERNRKYYTIVRSHGMRIKDARVNRAYQPFAAVVYVEGEELNNLLASLENAAHDDFITKDENMEIDKRAIHAISSINDAVIKYVCEQTKIDADEGQEIEGLSNIISMPGSISSVKRKNNGPVIKRNVISKKGKGKKSKDYNGATGGSGNGEKSNKKRKGKRQPFKEGGEREGILYENYTLEPVFIKIKNDYSLRLQVSDNIRNGNLFIHSINSDGKKDNSISDYIESVMIDGTRRQCISGKVKNVSFLKDKLYDVKVKMKHNVTYQLAASICIKEDEINE